LAFDDSFHPRKKVKIFSIFLNLTLHLSHPCGYDPTMNEREYPVERARRSLGDERLMAFVRAAAKEKRFSSCADLRRMLRAKLGLREIFFTGYPWGFTIRCRKIRKDYYRIRMTCCYGYECGDGGEWEVWFKGNRVTRIELDICIQF
jgi:hypothetical protein